MAAWLPAGRSCLSSQSVGSLLGRPDAGSGGPVSELGGTGTVLVGVLTAEDRRGPSRTGVGAVVRSSERPPLRLGPARAASRAERMTTRLLFKLGPAAGMF